MSKLFGQRLMEKWNVTEEALVEAYKKVGGVKMRGFKKSEWIEVKCLDAYRF